MGHHRNFALLGPLHYRRLLAILALLLAGFGWMFARLHEIQVARHREFVARARQYSTTTRVLEARRGEIRDRNGVTLAISSPVKEVYLDPALCSNRVDQAAVIVGKLLDIPPASLATKIRATLKAADRGVAPARRALLLRKNVPLNQWNASTSSMGSQTFGFPDPAPTPAQRDELSRLRRNLLFARDRQQRLYPWGESLCQLLGFMGTSANAIGSSGVRGLELACDQILAGRDGLLVSQQDVAGNELPARRTRLEQPIDGNHVVLTIDLRIQQIVEQEIASARVKYEAKNVSAIVMDPATGEILALASSPGFNPQQPGAAPEPWRNRAFTDMVEPGSIMKFITLAAALEERVTTLDSTIDCEGGSCVINNVPVRDHGSHRLLTVRQSFAKSSNIAFAKLGVSLGPDRLYRAFTNFGLARKTGTAFANETPGLMSPPREWSTMTLTRAAFGQGVSVSQLQMAAAMSVIANEGRLMQPRLVARIESPQGQVLRLFGPRLVRSAVSPGTARQVKEALITVVSPGGTGALAALDDYTVAAKTGTAQKANARGYLADLYYSSMLGFFPADNPRVVISVALDEPRNGYYAGTVAAPVFRAIAERIAEPLQIAPDKIIPAPANPSFARATPPKPSPARSAAFRRPGAPQGPTPVLAINFER